MGLDPKGQAINKFKIKVNKMKSTNNQSMSCEFTNFDQVASKLQNGIADISQSQIEPHVLFSSNNSIHENQNSYNNAQNMQYSPSCKTPMD